MITNHFYKSQPGDSLSRITLKYYGDALLWPQLYQLNRAVVGSDPNTLKHFTELWMPPLLQDKLITTEGLRVYKIGETPPKYTPSAEYKEFMAKHYGVKKWDANKILIAGGTALLAAAIFLL